MKFAVCGPGRVTRYDREIDMGDRYGRSNINEISIGISIWNMRYPFGIWYVDMVIYHIDMVTLHFDMGAEANDMGERQYRYGHLPYRYGISCHSGPGG